MGNTVTISLKPVTLDYVLSYEKSSSKYKSVVNNNSIIHAWKFFPNEEDDSPTCVPILWASQPAFVKHESYLILHVQPNKFHPINDEKKIPSNTFTSKNNLRDLIKSTKHLTPRGTCSPFNFEPIETGGFGFDIYVWNGTRSDEVTKAFAIARGLELKKQLHSKGKNLLPLFIENMSPLTSVFNDDIILKKKDKRMSIHLYAKLIEIHSLSSKKSKGNSKRSKRYRHGSGEHNPALTNVIAASGVHLEPILQDKKVPKEDAVPKRPHRPKLSLPLQSLPLQSIPKLNGGPGGFALRLPPPETVDESGIENGDSRFRKSEKKRKASKLEQFDTICSKITENLFLGSDTVANNLKTLEENGITHVLNCAGSVCDNHFPDKFKYRTLYLTDGVTEDISCLLFDIIEWIDCSLRKGGNIFIHCLAEQEMQVLTNKGFLFLHDIEQHYDPYTRCLKPDSDLLICAYDSKSNSMQYQCCKQLIINPAQNQTLIEFTQRYDGPLWGIPKVNLEEKLEKVYSNHISLLVTPQHDMWAHLRKYHKRGGEHYDMAFNDVDKSCNNEYEKNHMCEKFKKVTTMEPFSKLKAGDLIMENPVSVRDNKLGVQFLAYAENGLVPSALYGLGEAPDYRDALGLITSDQVSAFLNIYGYWLRYGSLCFHWTKGGYDALSFFPVKPQDWTYLEERFSRLGLVKGIHWKRYRTLVRKTKEQIRYELENDEMKDYKECSEDYTYYPRNNQTKVQMFYFLVESRWVRYFHSHYQHNYANNWKKMVNPIPCSTLAYIEEDTAEIKSIKWLLPWCFKEPCDRVMEILEGIRFTEGKKTTKQNIIHTSSTLFRDQLVRLALHGGFSAYFSLHCKAGEVIGKDVNERSIIARHDQWTVQYTTNRNCSYPVLSQSKDVRRKAYNGRTWCVSVPSGLIIARRAKEELRKDGSSIITHASRPVVIGNCQQGVSRSSAMMIGYLMWKNGWPFEKTQKIVKDIRGVSSPNAGFIFHLLTLEKRLEAKPSKSRFYHIVPQSKWAKDYLVAKEVTQKAKTILEADPDPDSCFIFHTAECIYLWVGSECDEKKYMVAKETIRRLQRFEKAVDNVKEVRQGDSESVSEFYKIITEHLKEDK